MLFSIVLAIITLIIAINSIFYLIIPLKIIEIYAVMYLYEKIVFNCIQFFIPYVIMVTLNIMVILRLRQSKRRAGLNNSLRQMNQANSAIDKGSRFTITTILIDLIFLVFNFPCILISIYNLLIIYKVFTVTFDLTIIFSCFGYVLFSSYSAVLFIMFIVFNRIFRKEFVNFFKLEKLVNILSPSFLNSSSNRI